MAEDLRGRASLTGAVFAILLVISFVVSGETPGIDESTQEVVSFYTENDAKVTISAILSGISAVFLLFFVGSLRSVLRSSEGATAGLSAVAHAGGVVAAVGILIFGGLMFTLGDAADNLDPAATQALNALNVDFFFPLAGGMAAFLIATGLAAVRTRALPPWLGWAALVIGVATFTPLGFFAFLASIAWILVASILLGLGKAGAPVSPITGGEPQP